MRLREFRRADAARFYALLKTEFPEEEAILGMRPEGFQAVIGRLYRTDVRLLLGILRAVHRSPFHLYVVEEDGAIAATTLLSFTPRAGFVSTVVVAPEFRRRGFARQLLDGARRETARRGRPHVALRVLESNTPARALYDSLGYRPIDRHLFLVLEAPAPAPAAGAPGAIRPFRRSDAGSLAEIANRASPEEVRNVLPMRPRDLGGDSWADRLFSAETAAWVVDRGAGPEAYVAATSTPTTDAAHLSTPIVGPSVDPSVAAELLRTAVAWLSARRPARVVTTVSEASAVAHRALEEAGFHDAIPHYTLCRSSAPD